MGKLKKEKHNHKLTDFLKVGIFSLVMLAPFISIGSKMAYVTFNKNAKDSYYGENINETKYVNVDSKNKLVNGENYYFDNTNGLNISSVLLGDSNHGIYITNCELLLNNGADFLFNPNEIYFMSFYNASGENIMYTMFKDENLVTLTSFASTSRHVILTFTYISNDLLNDYLFTNTNVIQKIQYNKDSYLDNVFEYAVDQLGTTPIFAWTKNTAIYTPIETMTNGLGFDPDNNTLAILLTYWSLVTAVYVIMDIILFAFTKITHFTQD